MDYKKYKFKFRLLVIHTDNYQNEKYKLNKEIQSLKISLDNLQTPIEVLETYYKKICTKQVLRCIS